MKISRTLTHALLSGILFILSGISAFAEYSVPVEHMHSGRTHTHELPIQGLAHRHGIGALGEAMPSSRRQATGTVIYTQPQSTVKPPKPSVQIDNNYHEHDGRAHSHPLPVQGIYHRHGSGAIGKPIANAPRHSNTIIYGTPQPSVTPQKRDSFSFDIFRSSNNPRSAEWRDKKRNDRRDNRRNRINLSNGDTNCRAGDPDCNVCAADVEQQFQRAAAQQISWRTEPWSFDWPKRYPPENLSPLDIFNGDPGHALGIPDTHVQGFVRTNSSKYPFAGSHSHKKRGGIFVVRNGRGGESLATLHSVNGRHPSGVHIIGKYLVYGEGNRLYFKDINKPRRNADLSLPLSKPSFGGGLGVLKLDDNRHLIVTSGPGGQDSRPRYNRFYLLKSINGTPSSISFLNESATTKPAQWPAGLGYSENLSLITDCGSGDIYAIHTTGDEKGIGAISGNGYWRLSKLVQDREVLGLTAVNAFISKQNMKSCNVRAAATVHVNPSHKLEFYCHGYAKDPDGSLFNVLGKSSRNRDQFYYKIGTVR